MELQFFQKDIDEQGFELLYLPVLENINAIKAWISFLGYEDEKELFVRLQKEKFSGKAGQLFVIHSQDLTVVLAGAGAKEKFSQENWRELTAYLVKFLKTYQVNKVALIAKAWLKGTSDISLLAKTIAESWHLTNYSFNTYKKTDNDKIELAVTDLGIELDNSKKRDFKNAWEQGLLFAESTILARDLVNEPASVMTPSFLAETAVKIAKANPQIKAKILDKEQVEKLGMHAYLGIDQGSEEPLKFIHLIYQPKAKTKEKIALVGKGITFDSGGLNIKVGDGMTDMKVDMAGAATVLGVFSVLARLKIKAEVHGIIAACENMPSGKAIKPGDVVKNMQGKTIEIGNTDAEGRVTLADALAYAQKQKVDTIVDLATLTGACIIALGSNYAALYANQENLAKDLLKAASTSGEKIWRMPLAPEYKDLNKSNIADIRNIASARGGGSITAALFLEEFIISDVAWAHLDIAGPAYAEKPLNAYTPVGGVGFGVRTLLEWLNIK